MNILVTGGAGYIGSHTVVELLENEYGVVVVDSLVNSSREAVKRVEAITGKMVPFYQVDLCDRDALDAVFAEQSIDAVIHFAGLKAVGESVEKPLLYYHNNIDATLSLLGCMHAHDVTDLVFSSSATVYGSAPVPYEETYPAGHDIPSPYGKTKHMIETILTDYAASNSKLRISSLRYFNPIGAHTSGTIGEDPKGIPNNLLPFITQVAVGARKSLSVFGNDYDTLDGTCIRDYIHVTDVAKGHIAALSHLKNGHDSYNLGSGKGISVLGVVQAFERATGVPIPVTFAPRRSGDLPAFYADVHKAEKDLGWTASLSVEQACTDAWNWQTNNPNGFDVRPQVGSYLP